MTKRPLFPTASESSLLEKKSRHGSEEAANSRRRQILDLRSMLRRQSEGTTLADGCNSEKITYCIWTSSVKRNPRRMECYCRADMEEHKIAKLVRKDRRRDAEEFRSNYTYGTSTDDCEKKTCICSSGTYSWLGKSSGIMWAAVHGIDSICVVTKDEKLDVARVHGFLKCRSENGVFECFREAVVSEIEDIADPSCRICQDISCGMCQSFDLHQNVKKPFGVVSVISGTDKIHEENGHEVSNVNYDGETAIKYFEEKMKSDCAFSFNETVEAAISAFQHLFHRKFKAKEIRVSVWTEGRMVRNMLRSDVKERLSVINKGVPF